jgi:hypothetical protein
MLIEMSNALRKVKEFLITLEASNENAYTLFIYEMTQKNFN